MDIEIYAKRTHFYNIEIPQSLEKLLTENKWRSYLDLGCGDGSLLWALARKKYFEDKVVYAVDLSQKRINKVKKINKNFICFVDCACNVEDIKNGTVDFLVSTQVIEHVPSDEAMVKEIKRILSNDGFFYISTVFKRQHAWYFYRCNGRWVLDPTHLREYTRDGQLMDIFRKNGLEIVETKKSPIFFSVLEGLLKLLNVDGNIFNNNYFLNLLRKIRVPIIGYYNWEIIGRNL